jgi:hypothetical protein
MIQTEGAINVEKELAFSFIVKIAMVFSVMSV